MYDRSGRLLDLHTEAIRLEANRSFQMLLPLVIPEAASYRVFLLDAQQQPLTAFPENN